MTGFGSAMWDDPELYDLENADDPGFDLGFWSDLMARLRPGRVLELACGTGRLTIPLAHHLPSIVGVDSSAPFVRRARERLEGLPPEVRGAVEFVEGDMRG